MAINGIRNFADGVVRPLVKKLDNGKQVLSMEKNGKTITQVLNQDGKKLKTRIKEIYSSPTRTSVKKTLVRGEFTTTVNNITLKNGNNSKTKLSILEQNIFFPTRKSKTFYDDHISVDNIFNTNEKYIDGLSKIRLKIFRFNKNGIRESYDYYYAYGKQNCANIFPQKGGVGEADMVFFNEHGMPTWPQMNLEGLEKYL